MMIICSVYIYVYIAERYLSLSNCRMMYYRKSRSQYSWTIIFLCFVAHMFLFLCLRVSVFEPTCFVFLSPHVSVFCAHMFLFLSPHVSVFCAHMFLFLSPHVSVFLCLRVSVFEPTCFVFLCPHVSVFLSPRFCFFVPTCFRVFVPTCFCFCAHMFLFLSLHVSVFVPTCCWEADLCHGSVHWQWCQVQFPGANHHSLFITFNLRNLTNNT